jgi:hypothetical protein
MLNMQTFHKKMVSPRTRNQGSYLNALSAITRIKPDKLNILASELDWEQWAPATEPTNI